MQSATPALGFTGESRHFLSTDYGGATEQFELEVARTVLEQTKVELVKIYSDLMRFRAETEASKVVRDEAVSKLNELETRKTAVLLSVDALEVKQKELEPLGARLDGLREEQRQMQADADGIRQELEKLRSERDALASERDAAAQSREQLVQERNEAQKAAQLLRDERGGMEGVISGLRTDFQRIKQEVEGVTAQREGMAGLLKELRETEQKARDAANAAQKEIDTAKKAVQDLEAKRDGLRGEIDDLNSKRDWARGENEGALKELEEKRAGLDQLKGQKSGLSDEIQKLNDSKKSNTEALTHAQEELREINDVIAERKDARSKVSDDLKSSEAAKQKADGEKADLESKLTPLRAEFVKLDADVAKLKEEAGKAKVAADEARQSLEEARKEERGTVGVVASAHKELVDLRMQIDRLKLDLGKKEFAPTLLPPPVAKAAPVAPPPLPEFAPVAEKPIPAPLAKAPTLPLPSPFAPPVTVAEKKAEFLPPPPPLVPELSDEPEAEMETVAEIPVAEKSPGMPAIKPRPAAKDFDPAKLEDLFMTEDEIDGPVVIEHILKLPKLLGCAVGLRDGDLLGANLSDELNAPLAEAGNITAFREKLAPAADTGTAPVGLKFVTFLQHNHLELLVVHPAPRLVPGVRQTLMDVAAQLALMYPNS